MKKLNIIVACEESQAVTIEFRKRGVEAYSCDILPCSGGHPEWHIQTDVALLIGDTWNWNLVIAFPPCTDLAVSGARWFPEKRANGSQQRAIDFFLQFTFWRLLLIALIPQYQVKSVTLAQPTTNAGAWHHDACRGNA